MCNSLTFNVRVIDEEGAVGYMLERAVGYQHQRSARIQRSERMGVRTRDPEDGSVEARRLLLRRQCGNKKVVVFFFV
jgi:hypothetical protein